MQVLGHIKMKNSLYIIIIFFIGCSKTHSEQDGLVINTQNIIIYAGDSIQMDVKSNDDIDYQSINDYHATVSSSGLVNAIKVGQTYIKVSTPNQIDSVPVLVRGNYNIYPTPIINNWQLTRDSCTMLYPSPYKTLENIVYYLNYSDCAPLIMYAFNNEDILISVAVVVDISHYHRLNYYLEERFIFAYEKYNYSVYENESHPHKITMLVVNDLLDENHRIVIYEPYKPTSKSSGQGMQLFSAEQAQNNIIKEQILRIMQ